MPGMGCLVDTPDPQQEASWHKYGREPCASESAMASLSYCGRAEGPTWYMLVTCTQLVNGPRGDHESHPCVLHMQSGESFMIARLASVDFTSFTQLTPGTTSRRCSLVITTRSLLYGIVRRAYVHDPQVTPHIFLRDVAGYIFTRMRRNCDGGNGKLLASRPKLARAGALKPLRLERAT